MAFADTLRRLRLGRFWSQAELPRRSGVSPFTINRLEGGAESPRLRTVRRLAQALGVDPAELAAPEELAEFQRKAAA
jgi:transcriptional regulator with XRE-family HTH domain